MAKLKSHSGAKKRLYRTGKGRLFAKRNSRNHLLLQKNKRQKHLARPLAIHGTNYRHIAPLVPYL